MHFKLLHDELKQFPVRLFPGLNRPLGIADGANRFVELQAPREQNVALLLQNIAKLCVWFQQVADLLQGNAEKFQDHDLFEPREIPHAIQAVSRLGALLWPQQSQPVVMMQRPHGHARQAGEFLRAINFLGSGVHGFLQAYPQA